MFTHTIFREIDFTKIFVKSISRKNKIKMFTIIPLVGGVQHKVGGAHGRRQHVGAVVVLALLF